MLFPIVPSSCFSQVNWTLFLERNTSGGLRVEPEISILYSTALIFSRVRPNLQTQSSNLEPGLFSLLTMEPRLCLRCWSTTMLTTRRVRPPSSSPPTSCRTSPGPTSTCRLQPLSFAEPPTTSPTDRSVCR